MAKSIKSASSFFLFLLGVGCETKVYFFGTIAISELVVFALAPLLLLTGLKRMRKEGFLSFVCMVGFMMSGLFLSAWVNHSPWPFVVKLVAIFYSYIAYYVVFYRLLHDNYRGLGFFIFGATISELITIWAFNPTAEVSSSGFAYIAQQDVEDIVRGPLFWIGKVRGWGQLPIVALYLKTPILYSVITPILFVAFAMVVSISGRAQSVCVLMSGLMMLVGRKSRISMKKMGKHLWIILAACMLTVLCYKTVYSYAASHGYLGDAVLTKYEQQTNRGHDVVSMLVAGRTEFFIALTAAIDHPFIGLGPRAEDKHGYAENFLAKYGTDADVGFQRYKREYFARYGMVPEIPTHSHIMAAWLWCGLPGLIFFVWILYIVYKHFRFYLSTIPQWFGFFSMMLPTMCWSIFFNPFGARWVFALIMICIFYSRAVGRGLLVLPYDMEMEARQYG